MLDRTTVQAQLEYTLESIDLPRLGEKISGKVRDCYVLNDTRILIASDRLSAFDRVLTTIPFKGQLLTQMARHWFEKTKHIIPNHCLTYPHPNVMITREVEILPVEVIVRGYLSGSAWRDYQDGKAVSGIKLPAGMRKSQRFETPILTPSTKAERGQHDEPISSDEVIKIGLVSASLWEQVSEKALQLYCFGVQHAAQQGLILVDTKYEFGVLKDNSGEETLVLADEIHTPDSSRYWILETYNQLFEKGEDPEMLDKEFVRRWLISQGYMGDGIPPVFTDEFRVETAIRYMEAFEKITGEVFSAEPGPVDSSIKQAIEASFS